MTALEPPADLGRAERKAFRNLVQRLAERGVDPISRVGLVEDLIRADARLAALREAEKQAETGAKMPLTRAVNVAIAEKRRLHTEIFKGARKPAPIVVPLEEEPAVLETSEADTRWRAYIWRGDRTFSTAELERRFGPASWAALLYETPEEYVSWQRIVAEYPRGLRIPRHLIDEHNERFPKGPPNQPEPDAADDAMEYEETA